jgi:hypothetical protein
MKKLIVLIAALGLSGCAHWEQMSETEKQAWIFGGAIVLGSIALSTQEDKVIDNRDICFESVCQLDGSGGPHPLGN